MIRLSRVTPAEVLIETRLPISILGARWDRQRMGQRLPYSHRLIEELSESVDVAFDASAQQLLADYSNWSLAHTAGVDLDLPVPDDLTGCWRHQREAFWRAAWALCADPASPAQSRPIGGYVLALDMGTGKTKVALSLIRSLRVDRVLVVCPNKVAPVWPLQIDRHQPDLFDEFDVRNLVEFSSTEKRLKSMADLGPRGIVILNYEAFVSKAMRDRILSMPWDMMVLDEGHRIKSPSGVISRFFNLLGTQVPARIALTGTPMPHSPADIFALLRCIDYSLFPATFTAFKSRYCILGGFQCRQVVRFQNLEELSDLFGRVSFQVQADDVLDLPEEQHILQPVTLAPATRAVYDRLDKELVAWVNTESAPIVAANAMTKITALQQITSGYARDLTGAIVALGDEKAQVLAELFEDLAPDEPVVVFARYHHDLDNIHRVAEETKRQSAELSGRANNLAEWQAGHATVLAAQIQAAKEGIDLTRARYAVYFSHSFSYGDFAQSQRRTRRPGQTRKCIYYHLIAEDSVDGKIWRALERKRDVAEYVIELIRAIGAGVDPVEARTAASGTGGEGAASGDLAARR